MTGIHNKLTRFETPLFKRLLLESFLALANEIGTFRYQIHDLACRFEQEKRFMRKNIFYQNLTTGRVLRKKMFFSKIIFFKSHQQVNFSHIGRHPLTTNLALVFGYLLEKEICVNIFMIFFLNRAYLKSFQIKLTK